MTKSIRRLCPLLLLIINHAAFSATSAVWAVNNFWGGQEHAQAADFTGDRIFDLASPSSAGVRMKLSTATGFIDQTWSAGSNWSTGGHTVAGDFDGDGLSDIASAQGGAVYVKLNRGTANARFDEYVWPVSNTWGGAEYTFAGDFNGDGKADIASANAGSVYLKLSNGSGFTSVTWPVTNAWGSGPFTFAGDFNGDGKTDIASVNGGTAYMKLSTGSGFTSTTWSIPNSWGGSGYAVAGDFNGDGKYDIASPNSGTVLVKTSTGSGFVAATNWTVTNAWGSPGWSFGGDFTGDGFADLASPNASTVYMKLNEPPVAANAGATNSRYYVRVGDINGDGYRDLLVTGNGQRNVADFILQRSAASATFQIIATPTSAQLQTAQTWPLSNIAVFREDLNFDGYFDFYIERIHEVVPGADDVIVYTQRGVGSTPAKLVNINSTFRLVEDAVREALNNGRQYLADFYAQTCIARQEPTWLLPPVPYDWIYTGSPDQYYRDGFILYYGSIPYNNGYTQFGQTCYVHGHSRLEPVKRFVREVGDYLGLQPSTCNDCPIHAQTVLANTGGWVIRAAVTARSAQIARAAWILTGILLADDVTLVGAVDDVLLPITILVGATAEVVRVISESQPPDVGPKSNPDTSNGSDPFQKPPGYDPKDPNKIAAQSLPKNAASSSKRLGDNLEAAGWTRPANAEAHHVVRQTAVNENVQASQDMLTRNSVHMDEAANGGFLPENTEAAARAGTRATPHSIIHRKTTDALVRQRLAAAEAAGGGRGNAGSAIRAELQAIMDEFLNGTFPLQ